MTVVGYVISRLKTRVAHTLSRQNLRAAHTLSPAEKYLLLLSRQILGGNVRYFRVYFCPIFAYCFRDYFRAQRTTQSYS